MTGIDTSGHSQPQTGTVIAVTLSPPTAAYLITFTGPWTSAMPPTPPLGQVLLPFVVVCGLLSAAMVAGGRLGTRLQRVDNHSRTDPHNQHLHDVRERALRLSRISCYSAASLLLLIALVLAADTYFIPQ
jgi:hypothetical protein